MFKSLIFIFLFFSCMSTSLGSRNNVELFASINLIQSTPKLNVGTDQLNNRPIFGIFTQPYDLAPPGMSYLAASYVKWLESAGARVVPILYDMDRHELKYVFSTINGIVFPGGGMYLRKGSSLWIDNAEYLFKLARRANEQGEHFPVHGTCLGFQLLATLVSEDSTLLIDLDSENWPSRLNFTAEANSSTWVKGLPAEVVHDLANSEIAMFNHQRGISLETFRTTKRLRDFFRVIATNKDREGVEYVAVYEAYNYPFTATAWHAEKVPYEWNPSLKIPHTSMAVHMAYHTAEMLVSSGRQNQHAGHEIADEDDLLIYNWTPEFMGRHKHGDKQDAPFEQVYLFDIDDFRERVKRHMAKAK